MKLLRISSFGVSNLLIFCSAAFLLPAGTAIAQDQTAPPPLKIVTRQDRMQLDAVAKDTKARVRLTLELAEAHLANIETQTAQQNYDEAAAEAGKYSALIEDVFVFLGALKQDSNKTRDLYKRVELTLRTEGSRLTIVRRTTPAAYAVWMKEIEDFARHGRTEALNSFYGQTVIRERNPTPLQRPGTNTVQNNAVPPEKKP